MPVFNYTSGNIADLVANTTASMADIQGPFNDIKTFLTGGLDETNVPNLAAAFTKYERIDRARTTLTSPAVATYLLQLGTAASNIAVNAAQAFAQAHVMRLDPAFHAANARTTKLNLQVQLFVNAIAPAVNYTVGLYSVTTFGGASANEPFVSGVSVSPITGSSVVFTAPSASSQPVQTSGDFNFPAAGDYVLGITPSGVATTNTVIGVLAQLYMREV